MGRRGAEDPERGLLVAGTLTGNSSDAGWRAGSDEAAGNHLIAVDGRDVVGALQHNSGPNSCGWGDFLSNQAVDAGHLVPVAFGGNNTSGPRDVASALSAHGGASGRMDFETETFIAQPIAFHGSQDPDVSGDVTHPLGRNYGQEACIAFDPTQITHRENRSNPQPGDPCHTLARGAHAPAIAFQERGREDGRTLEIGGDAAYALTAPKDGGRAQERNLLDPQMRVRRLMPVECERLQGFEPGYTDIVFRGKPASDGVRYKALGNSWACNVPAWVGRRIALVDDIQRRSAS